MPLIKYRTECTRADGYVATLSAIPDLPRARGVIYKAKRRTLPADRTKPLFVSGCIVEVTYHDEGGVAGRKVVASFKREGVTK